jgi:hypothetical protein
MNISYREKSIWVSLLSTLFIFGYYFYSAFAILRTPILHMPHDSMFALMGLFIGVMVWMIIVQIVLHIILAIVNRGEAEKDEDERDKLIELKATSISYYLLVLGVWMTIFSLFVIQSPAWTATILLFTTILAELVGFAVQLFYYRRGV